MALKGFAKVIRGPPEIIKKEITFNLLEDVPLLYIHICSFFFMKSKVKLSKSEIAEQNQDLSDQI